MVDVPRPLKLSLPDYKAHEEKWEAVLAKKFGLAHPMPKIIKFADNMALALERDSLFSVPPLPWEPLPEVPLEFRAAIQPIPWQSVENRFLKAFYALCGDEDDE
jgi:hypothetical protein